MPFGRAAAIAAGLLALAASAVSAEVVARDAVLRIARPGAPTAAFYVTLTNDGDAEVRLTGAASAAAARVELHESTMDANGVMRMQHLAEGLVIPAGGTATLAPGGMHLMLMGLARLAPGAPVAVTLQFDGAAPLTLDATAALPD